MTRQFFSQLALISGATAATLAVIHLFFQPIQAHWKFGAITLLAFALTCAGLFYAGKSTAKSKSKVAFNNIISLSVFGKMALSMALIFAYKAMAQPENNWFLLSFFLIYVVFTVFEVTFMTRLAKA